MTTNNNKDIVTSEVVWTRQLVFACVTFLSSIEVSVVFNIPSSHAYTNFSKRRFSPDQLLTSKYLSVLHPLLHSQSHVLGICI